MDSSRPKTALRIVDRMPDPGETERLARGLENPWMAMPLPPASALPRPLYKGVRGFLSGFTLAIVYGVLALFGVACIAELFAP